MHISNILVVDDDPTIRNALTAWLKRKDFNTFSLSSGVGIVEIIEAESIDLVFLDILMPDKEGLASLTDIREFFPNLPVVVISGDETYLSLTSDLGANYQLQKPFSFDEVDALIGLFKNDKINKAN